MTELLLWHPVKCYTLGGRLFPQTKADTLETRGLNMNFKPGRFSSRFASELFKHRCCCGRWATQTVHSGIGKGCDRTVGLLHWRLHSSFAQPNFFYSAIDWMRQLPSVTRNKYGTVFCQRRGGIRTGRFIKDTQHDSSLQCKNNLWWGKWRSRKSFLIGAASVLAPFFY